MPTRCGRSKSTWVGVFWVHLVSPEGPWSCDVVSERLVVSLDKALESVIESFFNEAEFSLDTWTFGARMVGSDDS